MAREETCEVSAKIKEHLGGSIPMLDRLKYLDDSIWKLGMLKGYEIKFSQRICYKRKTIFGFSRTLRSEQVIIIEDEIADRIIEILESEYQNQLKKCEELIRKLER